MSASADRSFAALQIFPGLILSDIKPAKRMRFRTVCYLLVQLMHCRRVFKAEVPFSNVMTCEDDDKVGAAAPREPRAGGCAPARPPSEPVLCCHVASPASAVGSRRGRRPHASRCSSRGSGLRAGSLGLHVPPSLCGRRLWPPAPPVRAPVWPHAARPRGSPLVDGPGPQRLAELPPGRPAGGPGSLPGLVSHLYLPLVSAGGGRGAWVKA